MIKKHELLVFSVLIMLTSCINLKSINSYSESSTVALKSFDEIGFSFKTVCQKNCEFRINSDETAIANRINNEYKPITLVSKCDCENFDNADLAFNKMYFATIQYLEGLHSLSNGDVLTFKYDTLAKALNETDILNVKEEEVEAFNKLVNTTTKFIVDIKRRKDLKDIIASANSSFTLLIDRIKFAVDGPLKLSLETEIELEYNYYKAIIFNQKDLSLKDKIELEKEFIHKRDKIIEKINLLNIYSEALAKIRDGHQAIYENRELIHKEELAEIIAGYITDIREIKTSFGNIKTE